MSYDESTKTIPGDLIVEDKARTRSRRNLERKLEERFEDSVAKEKPVILFNDSFVNSVA